MRTLTALVLSSALVPIMAASAHAQSTTPPVQQDPACAPALGADPPTTGSGANSNLSDKLAESKGVLCPPESADKEMAVPPPATGSRTPVIPPPGSPQGDQSVQPK